ncbi:MAG: hypothetical protein JST42_30035 [Bacteroidetes bacterium]|nr:hypothetical protein [Bacteroidota bacterium]
MRKAIKIVLFVAVIGLVLVVAGYFIAGPLIRKKVDSALRQLPPSLQVSYGSLEVKVLSGSVVMRGVHIAFTPLPETLHRHRVSIERIDLAGVRLVDLVFRKELKAGSLVVAGCSVELDERLLDSPVPKIAAPLTSVSIGDVRLKDVRVALHKGKVETVVVAGSGTVVDGRKASLSIDSLRLWPGVDKFSLGRTRGHQVDWVEARSGGIKVVGLDVGELFAHRLIADEISIGHSVIYVFRDRRLPLESGEKPMPATMLERLPVDIRVRSVRAGPISFTYEEFPRKGDSTGVLKIVKLRCSVAPLINHPRRGDPAYVAIRTEGSLMGSGTVEANTRVPLRDKGVYEVEGAFHELDVTRLNASAENLGGIRLESGMLNSLEFSFRMDNERATGHIVGEYHHLVADKLKGNKKVDKLKSFFLKKLIIPKDKDKRLPVAKRTGKVDYKRDPERYFSYYLLHSLLVGVKDSFTLGFLLPG